MNIIKTTWCDFQLGICEHRIYIGVVDGIFLNIVCPFCGVHIEVLRVDLFLHEINCRCGALLTWWNVAYRKKSDTQGLLSP